MASVVGLGFSRVVAAATEYLTALADPNTWNEEAWRHHFQPAWTAAIATHVRFRGRRAAMRLSREYRAWPVYAHDADMIYTPGRDETTGAPIDLSDTHTRLGRLVITRRAALTEQTVLAVLLAESTAEVADALTAALSIGVQVGRRAGSPGSWSLVGLGTPALAAIRVVDALGVAMPSLKGYRANRG